MIKIESIDQVNKIQKGDIVVKYPIEGEPVHSFAGRSLENSIAYEVEDKSDGNQTIRLAIPDNKHTRGVNKTEELGSQPEPVQKTFNELISEKVWWVAKP